MVHEDEVEGERPVVAGRGRCGEGVTDDDSGSSSGVAGEQQAGRQAGQGGREREFRLGCARPGQARKCT